MLSARVVFMLHTKAIALKKQINLNTLLIVVLGIWFRHEVARVLDVVDQFPVVLKRVEMIERFQMLQDERLRQIEDRRARQP